MKATTRTILKWLLLLFLAALSVCITVWAHGEASRHVCTGIDIEITDYRLPDSILKAGVRERLNEYPVKIVGSQISAINTEDIRKYLSALKNFENVEVMITSTGELKVQVVPMIPVMRVFYGGESYYINKDGKQIATDADFYTDVPVVTGRFSLKFKPVDVLPVVKFISTDPLMKDLVAMVEARDRNDIILVPRIAGHVVNFGDTSRLEEKRDALALFYNKVMPYRSWQTYDTISVKFRGQVVATRRNKEILNHAEQYEEEVDMEEATLPDAPEVNAQTETAE